jgi:hypothetical protein
MTTITKERAAVVIMTVWLLWWRGPSLAHVLAACIAVPFFWWFVTPTGRGQNASDSSTRAS